MNLIAHRGYKTEYIKENTDEAFTNAVNHNFHGIELDVRRTKDNELVVCHDAFLSRVTDQNGLLRSYTYSELVQFNFGSKEVPSKIPLLKDVLFKYDILKIVELKEEVDIDSIIKYADNKTYFISFNTPFILKLKNKYPRCKFGILNYVLNSLDTYNLDAICLLDDIATTKMVDYFLDKGIKVFIYGVGAQIKYIDERENIFYIVDKKY